MEALQAAPTQPCPQSGPQLGEEERDITPAFGDKPNFTGRLSGRRESVSPETSSTDFPCRC